MSHDLFTGAVLKSRIDNCYILKIHYNDDQLKIWYYEPPITCIPPPQAQQA